LNWHSFFFFLFALITCLASVAVVVSTNVVRMAVYLIVSLAATSGLFFLAGADFVGAMQLMIYVGGTLVLLIFGVMLTAQGPFINLQTRGGEWVLSAVVAAGTLAVLIPVALSVPAWHGPTAQQVAHGVQPEVSSTQIGEAFTGLRPDAPDAPVALQPGLVGYLHPFELISVHLLVVLIGAAYLARPKKSARTAPVSE